MSAQLGLFKYSSQHGGDIGIGKRKTARPIHTRKAMHLVLRSDNAIGKLSLLLHERKVRTVFQKQAKQFHVQVYELAVNKNHIHALVKAQTREGFKSFLRAVTGLIARHLLQNSTLRHFWTNTVFSRIIEWGKSFRIVKEYLLQNELEAYGIIPYKERKHKKAKAQQPLAQHTVVKSKSSSQHS